jgi:riboflavin synthase
MGCAFRYHGSAMFTGIITAVGTVCRVRSFRLTVASELIVAELRVGGSVAVQGACLTVTAVQGNRGEFEVELSPETESRTTLGGIRSGDPVNLELPLKLSDRLGGHLVQGHIDTVGAVVSIEPQGESHLFAFEVAREFDTLLVEKGAVAIDGVSLTPFHIGKGRFEVAVVPHTYRATTLRALRVGDRVNVEFDLLAKYVARQLRERRP